MTDAGTPSGHCNELISARRNPPRWFVNLHQIGSTVLPVNLIHPSAYTVVAYQVQGPSCASCTVHLVCVPFFLFVSAKGALQAATSQSGRYRASCFPAGSSWVPAIHINLCCTRRSPPLSQKMSSNNCSKCILSISYDPLVDQMLSPAHRFLPSGSISWFKHCAHGASLVLVFAVGGTCIPQIVNKSGRLEGHRRHVRLP